MTDEQKPLDTVPSRIRELGVRWQEGRSLAVAAYYMPEAVSWLVHQPRVEMTAAANSLRKSALHLRRALGDFFSGDMLESREHRKGFLAGATWVLVELTEAYLGAPAREPNALGGKTNLTRAQQVLDAVTEQLLYHTPLGAKEILSEEHLKHLKLRPDEVSRAFTTLLSQNLVEVVPNDDRRRRLFRYLPNTVASPHTVSSSTSPEEAAHFEEWEWDWGLSTAIDMGRELVGANRGPGVAGPSLELPGDVFLKVVGRPRHGNEAPLFLCFAKDAAENTMEVSLPVPETSGLVDHVVVTMKTDVGVIKAALFEDDHPDPTPAFRNKTVVSGSWPTVSQVGLRVISREAA